jgi:hypothetical protein
VPGAVATDIRALAEAALRISVIERTLMSLLSELQLVGGEITRVRSVVEPQQKKVPRIEQTVQTMDQRTAVTERTLLDLKEKVDAAPSSSPIPTTMDAVRSQSQGRPHRRLRAPPSAGGGCS